jgi:predicted AlkP superfamily phosphohydrolase/phosphomutase
MNHTDKVVIIGLDAVPPELVFGGGLGELPTLKWLMGHGLYGELESTIPSITCPAWASMVTGKDPGRLGIYGFRNRTRYDYGEMAFVDSSWVMEEALWDILSRYGRRSILIGVPPSYPPKPINGQLVSCFMAGESPDYTYPREFRTEVEALSGGYISDVKDFRSEDKESILREVYEMTRRRFRLAKALLTRQDWDLFMMVEMGTDRIQHAFWRYLDNLHPAYSPDTKYGEAIQDYYNYLDRELGELLTLIEGRATLIIVSDHGAKRMEGGICVNEWLLSNGYLRLLEYPKEITSFHQLKVDWRRTVAWAHSGYYGRVFLNVKGREPFGVIPPRDYERIRNEIAQGLEDLRDEHGRRLNTRAFKPKEIYSECRGIAPDLIVYFGDQYWRSIGSIGHKRFWTEENDNGPDYANHSQHGIFILYNKILMNYPIACESVSHAKRGPAHILDVAPTVLRCLGLEVPLGMRGSVLVNRN